MNKLVTTYSIIAVDSKHGGMGGAVQSHYFFLERVYVCPASYTSKRQDIIRGLTLGAIISKVNSLYL